MPELRTASFTNVAITATIGTTTTKANTPTVRADATA